MCHKKKLKFQDYKNCFEATQLDNKIKHPGKYEIDIEHIKETHREFIKNNTSILKTHQMFEIEGHVITEEINDEIIMQSIDSIERSSNKKGRN